MSKKQKFLNGLFEAITEIVLTLIFAAIGIFIVGLFGKESPLENIDGDALVLIGIATFAVIAVIVSLFVKLFKRRK